MHLRIDMMISCIYYSYSPEYSDGSDIVVTSACISSIFKGGVFSLTQDIKLVDI